MFKGSSVALVTPMHEDGRVDFSALAALVEWQIAAGTQAIVACGTTGESATLSFEEQQAVLTAVVDTVAGRVPVIAGTGTNDTQAVIARCEAAAALNVDACLVVTPYYSRPTQAGLFQHYEKIHDATSLPIMLYNVPSRTAVDLLPATVAKLSQLTRVIGIKEATGDLSRLTALQASCTNDFLYWSGDDSSACEFMRLGGHGVISVTANVAPQPMQLLCEAALAQQAPKANQLNESLALLHQRMMIESNPIPVKWALNAMGRIASGIRLPLTPLAEVHEDAVTEALTQAGVLNA